MERVYLVVLSLLLYITLSISMPPPNLQMPCIAYEEVDILIEEDWDFRIPYWENVSVSVVSGVYNIPPMSGPYTYHLSFCSGLNIYVGDTQDFNNAFGWSFGIMVDFNAFDINPGNASHEYAAFREFQQIYMFGDAGSPCTASNPRRAIVNIWCGLKSANCTQVPGNTGAQCMNPGGTTTPGFCLCSIQYTGNLCTNLTFNLLSNKCPLGRAVPIHGPTGAPPQDVSRMVGIAFAFLGVFVMVAIIGGYIYNFTVHSKRGCQAIPFYDTCTGQSVAPSYTSTSVPPSVSPSVPPSVPVSTGGYGSI